MKSPKNDVWLWVLPIAVVVILVVIEFVAILKGVLIDTRTDKQTDGLAEASA